MAKWGGSLWGLPSPSPTRHRRSVSLPSPSLSYFQGWSWSDLVMHMLACWQPTPSPESLWSPTQGTLEIYPSQPHTNNYRSRGGSMLLGGTFSSPAPSRWLFRYGGGCLLFFLICHPRHSPTFLIPALWTSAVLRNECWPLFSLPALGSSTEWALSLGSLTPTSSKEGSWGKCKITSILKPSARASPWRCAMRSPESPY